MKKMNIQDMRSIDAGGYLEIKCSNCGKQYVYLPYIWKGIIYYNTIAGMNKKAQSHANSRLGQILGCKWWNWTVTHW